MTQPRSQVYRCCRTAPSPGEEEEEEEEAAAEVLSTAPEGGVSEAGGNYPGGAAGNQ